MEDFRRQFLLEAVARLEDIAKNLRDVELPAESFKRETFRTLHTVKGTAQTFGFASAGTLAHALENLLAECKISDKLFAEGVDLLKESLIKKDFQIPPSFLARVGIEHSAKSKSDQTFDPAAEVPDELLAQLSVQEKNAVRAALENGKQLFCLEIGFNLNDFADGLVNFREKLEAAGEIIATLPSAKFKDDKIGFRILYASAADADKIAATARAGDAQVIYRSAGKASPNSLQNAAAYAVRHGKEIAEKSGKRVRFEVAADETELAADRLKIVFDVLIHLVRNAVDHAFENDGEIEITLKIAVDDLLLSVSDDGDGINSAAVRDRAIEKNLIPADAILTEQETIDLIFLPELSTRPAVTEISGRGVGLDAVKAAVVENGGTICVKSARGAGAVFQITLPLGQNDASAA